MKKIQIKYNPYTVDTEIIVNGEKPKANSALNVKKKRLQEWVEKFPQIVLEEYRDSNITIDFTGTVSDYDDIKSSFNAYKEKISVIFSRPLKTIFQYKVCIDKLYADSFYKVQKNSHSSFEVICCCS